MYKHKSYTFYDQRDFYFGHYKLYKMSQTFYIFLKNNFGNSKKCFIHYKHMDSNF